MNPKNLFTIGMNLSGLVEWSVGGSQIESEGGPFKQNSVLECEPV
jgi:hypothetical protein